MKQQRPVESTEDFKLRIAVITGDKSEQIRGARSILLKATRSTFADNARNF